MAGNIWGLVEYMDNKRNQIKIEPEPRYETRKAIEELAKELHLAHDDFMQDWPYEVVEPKDIEKYLAHYKTTEDDDKKFILMEMLIQSVEEQMNEEKFTHYCNIVSDLIEKDFLIHEYTIWYWCIFEEDDIHNTWRITPFLRELWHKIKGCST
jgi:hypothetical protein